MLPAHIIHDILEEEKKRRNIPLVEIQIEAPTSIDTNDSYSQNDSSDDQPNRGVAIVDYFE